MKITVLRLFILLQYIRLQNITVLRPVMILITHQIVNLRLKTFLLNDKKEHGFTIMYPVGHYRELMYQFIHYLYIMQECYD